MIRKYRAAKKISFMITISARPGLPITLINPFSGNPLFRAM